MTAYAITQQIEYQLPILLPTAYLTLDDAAAAILASEPEAQRISSIKYKGRRCDYRIYKLQLKNPEG